MSGAHTEHWRDVPGYAGRYQVSDHGRVRSRHSASADSAGRLLSAKKDHQGRLRVCLANAGTKKFPQIHRLVLEAFVGPCPAGQEAAHNDGDCTNNTVANLRWDTHWNNMQDKRRHGTCYQPKGELHPARALTEREVLSIAQSKRRQTDLAALFGVKQSTISDIKTGRTWSHVTGTIHRRHA